MCNVVLANTEEDPMTITADPAIIALLGTPNYARETRSDFTDLTAGMPKRYVAVSDHTRIVTGADDLKHPMAGRPGGVARSTPIVPDMTGHAVKADDEETLAPRDLRTEAQRDLMSKLVHDIGVLDMQVGMAALEYTVRMTEKGGWTPGRGGNASDWIGRLIAKYRALRDARKGVPACTNCNTSIRPDWCSVCREADPVEINPLRQGSAEAPSTRDNVQHDELIVRETKTGKPMPQYYAVEIDGVVKFYRVKAGTKPGWWWIDAQASDEFHPVRNVTTKNDILRAIIAAGPGECMRNYGRLIQHCGRCHRTLTDETSRANGIGPECEGKL